MALNKFMHPRNKYRKPPDFKALALKYPEFRKHAKQDISGKVSLNFKNVETLRVLTCTLLKDDFDLDVVIPPSRLIPTLPLRLNYLLWIEDLLKSNKITPEETVKGIDIGCGASCVYPLLAAKEFHWHMLATEVDTESAFIASSNVRKNKLQDMIKVRSVQEGTILDGVLDAGTVYHFCMCNPPFFSSVEELVPEHVSRTPNRPLPRNAHSGAPGELVAPGGEVAFISKVIEDSLKLKETIRIYSVMVGHKINVSKVKQFLNDAGVKRVVSTEFCQGRTTRWAVAWTLDPSIELTRPQTVSLSKKKIVPYSHVLDMDVHTTVDRLKELMEKLQIIHSTLKNNEDIYGMEITAMTNTWSHSRKKKRQEKFKQKLDIESNTEKCKAHGEECVENNKNEMKSATVYTEHVLEHIEEILEDKNPILKDNHKIEYENKDMLETKDDTNISGLADNRGYKRPINEDPGCSEESITKRLRLEEDKVDSYNSKQEPILVGSLVVKKVNQSSTVELCYIRGTGGKEAAHQVWQHLKNNLVTQ